MSSAEEHHRGLPFRWTAFGVSVAGVGFGIALLVSAQLGTAPADVVSTGSAHHLGTGVGTMGWVTAAVLAVLAVMLRRPPQWGSALGVLGVGQTVNWSLEVLPSPGPFVLRLAMMAVGLAIMYAAISVGVATNLGTGPIELVMLGLHDRGVPMHLSRWGIEAVLLGAGIALGGRIGIGTAAFVLLTGPVLARTIPPTARFMGTTAATLSNAPADSI